jgi:shikimate kinase
MDKPNIAFIGLSGVGKSTIGKAFAQEIGYRFVDTDMLLKQGTGKDPQSLLDAFGEAVFLEKEDALLASISLTKHVIATGGSAVYCQAGMAHLKTIALVIYLKDSPSNIRSRVKRLDKRGIVMAGEKSMSALMRTRQSLYEQMADVVFQMPFPFHVGTSVSQLKSLVFNTPLKRVLQ